MKWMVGVLFVFLFFCKEETSITSPLSEELIFEVDSLVKKSCLGEDCASIRLVWPEAKGDSRATAINKVIHEQLSGFIQMGEQSGVSLDSMTAEFFISFQDFKKEFPESHGSWEIDVLGRLSYESDSTVSIYFDHYYYLGGAHPNSSVLFINFDKSTGNFLSRNQVVLDEARLLQLAENKFRQYHQLAEENLQDDERFFIPETGFFLAQAMGFKEGKFWVIYIPYEIGPYALGYTELEFSKAELGNTVRW